MNQRKMLCFLPTITPVTLHTVALRNAQCETRPELMRSQSKSQSLNPLFNLLDCVRSTSACSPLPELRGKPFRLENPPLTKLEQTDRFPTTPTELYVCSLADHIKSVSGVNFGRYPIWKAHWVQKTIWSGHPYTMHLGPIHSSQIVNTIW